MGTETQVSITRQDPAIEAYRLGLLKDTQGYIKQEIEKGTLPPDFQIANLSPEQQQAISMASQGVGAYQPYLQAGTQTLGQGIGATGAGIDNLEMRYKQLARGKVLLTKQPNKPQLLGTLPTRIKPQLTKVLGKPHSLAQGWV
jgi:hypothetical protein